MGFLPGLGFQDGGTEEGFPHSLQNTAMRTIARQWEDISQYEKYNLVDLPARLRMMLLSYIAVYGPDEGVGLDGLRHLLIRPTSAEDDEVGQGWGEQVADNDDFFRLDLSRSLGRSIGFKNITSLVTLSDNNAGQAAQSEEAQESWEQEGFLTPNLRPILPHLTHLSLSHPLLSSSSTSWSKLLTFAKAYADYHPFVAGLLACSNDDASLIHRVYFSSGWQRYSIFGHRLLFSLYRRRLHGSSWHTPTINSPMVCVGLFGFAGLPRLGTGPEMGYWRNCLGHALAKYENIETWCWASHTRS